MKGKYPVTSSINSFTVTGLDRVWQNQAVTAVNVVRVDVKEIGALQLTCSCGGEITIPLSQRNIPKYAACPGCNTQWWDGPGKLYGRLCALTEALVSWNDLDQDKLTLGFSLPSQPS